MRHISLLLRQTPAIAVMGLWVGVNVSPALAQTPAPKQSSTTAEGSLTIQAGSVKVEGSASDKGVTGSVDSPLGGGSIGTKDGTATGTSYGGTVKAGPVSGTKNCTVDASTCTSTSGIKLGIDGVASGGKTEVTTTSYVDGQGNPVSKAQYDATSQRGVYSPEVAPQMRTQTCTTTSGSFGAGAISAAGSSGSCTTPVVTPATSDYCHQNPADLNCLTTSQGGDKTSSETVSGNIGVGKKFGGASAEADVGGSLTSEYKNSVPGATGSKQDFEALKQKCVAAQQSGALVQECLSTPTEGLYREDQTQVFVKGEMGATGNGDIGVGDDGQPTTLNMGAKVSLTIKHDFDSTIITPQEAALEDSAQVADRRQSMESDFSQTSDQNDAAARDKAAQDAAAANQSSADDGSSFVDALAQGLVGVSAGINAANGRAQSSVKMGTPIKGTNRMKCPNGDVLEGTGEESCK